MEKNKILLTIQSHANSFIIFVYSNQ